jgi:hypothetical protein
MSKPGRVVDHIVRYSVGRTTIRFQSATRSPIPRSLYATPAGDHGVAALAGAAMRNPAPR